MRLYLLPISTRRTLIFAQRLNITTTDKPSFLDKYTKKAHDFWVGWEKYDSGWRKKIVIYGNQALRRIPYEEWGLKSVPSLSTRRKDEELKDQKHVEVSFPSTIIPEKNISDILRTLATENSKAYKSRIIWSVAAMPLTIPVGLLPIIPNLPFIYLAFRVYSYYKALTGSKHILFLLNQNLVVARPSKILDELYSRKQLPFAKTKTQPKTKTSTSQTEPSIPETERMLLHEHDGKAISKALGIPELEVELDRAVWQVERALKAKTELREEKANLGTEDPQKK